MPSLVGSEMCIRDRIEVAHLLLANTAFLVRDKYKFHTISNSMMSDTTQLLFRSHSLYLVKNQCSSFLIILQPHIGLDISHVLCVDTCLLYTSDAADDMQCVDLGGRRIIKKKKKKNNKYQGYHNKKNKEKKTVVQSTDISVHSHTQ
eukprot:TRINITY_DN8984_c0_g1_i4.p1 TRINITY_DN8984_c0_g1~~TRINITY_DN8984_c0_g1_i4.p1  ORF type:complete len:147 (+),score=22.32 TRINITY_DN8984_c0_g1_i4:118-558(+)